MLGWGGGAESGAVNGRAQSNEADRKKAEKEPTTRQQDRKADMKDENRV